MATQPPSQFAYRTVSNLALSAGNPTYQPLESFQDPGGSIKIFQYSKDGSHFGWVSPESVKIIDAETAELINEIRKSNVVEIGFSPKGNYISTWERPVKLQDGSAHKNLIIWEVATGQELISFTQKSQNNWNVQWTEDETYFCRMVTNLIHFYDSKNIELGIHNKLPLDGINDFSLSPGKNPSIAVVIPEKNAAPAIVRIYSITNFNSPSAQKTFYKMDKVVMLWNDLGTSLLVLTQTEVDKTNKSYYGGGNIHGWKCYKEGPIHEVTWSPNSNEFIVIYGYMPFAKATLFNQRADPVHDFAGFGTLNGTVDIWDRESLKKITTFKATNSTECSWSPDGRYILTATLSPRLRVDNCYKIWHYTGVIINSNNFQELLQVQWRPANPNLYPMRSLSPPPKITQNSDNIISKPTPTRVGAYRPPHARARGSSNDIFKDTGDSNDNNSPVRSESTTTTKSTESFSRSSSLSRKQSINSIGSNISTSPLSETDKKVRNINKKLRQIAELKERKKRGDSLELTQVSV
ncbi:4428_t:CDS:10 [Entrophospora sp. SA101]|nr:4428_t:CDS:10 [Entrophospora sp. SA101]